MTASPVTNKQVSSLYDADYAAWIDSTLKKLKQQDYSSVDWENLIEEIEDMGRSEKRRLESNLTVVLLHLLKWQYQPERRSRSWNASIVEHRRRVRKDLRDSPSLKPYLVSIRQESYEDAVRSATVETGLPTDTFPAECEYVIAQILDDDFLPE